MSIIQERFRKARELLGFSQNAIAKKIGVTHTAIQSFESGKSEKPNWYYGQCLIEHGINPFYLMGLSDEIEGDLVEAVSKLEHEALQADYEKLKLEKENLEEQVSEMVSRSEFEEVVQENQTLQKVLKMLKIDR